jgi:hypothetical protein
MGRWPPLNDRQLAVLRRIADPDDAVSSGEFTLAQSVYALRARKLVDTIRVRGHGWVAEVTDAGRYYLQHGAYPPVLPAKTGANSGVDRPPSTAPPGSAPAIKAEDLVGQLEAAGGRLVVTDPDEPERAAWRRAVHAAKRAGLIRPGSRLRHSGRDRGDLVIELLDQTTTAPPTQAAARPRLPVPPTLEAPHPLVAQLQQRPDLLAVSDDSRPRALRITQALVIEAERRGYDVGLNDEGAPGFWIVVRQWTARLVLSEEWDTVDELPTGEEAQAAAKYDWQRIRPQRRTLPSGRLVVELPEEWGYRGRPRRWADRKRWRLDDKLIDVLAEIEARAELAEQRRLAAEHAATTRRQQWDKAMAEARQQLLADRRTKELLAQVKRWERAQRIRTYCDALEHTLPLNDPTTEGTLAWVRWARDHADSLDPLHRTPPPAAPDGKAIKPEDLRPYLGRWSPHGPDERY